MKPETRQKTREHFRDIALACASDAESGVIKLPSHVRVAEFAASWREEADAWMRGDYDHSFTFIQHAHYVETGDCVAFLP